MKTTSQTKVIIVMLVLQMIAVIVIAAFLYNFLVDRESVISRSIQETMKGYVSSIVPLPQQGPQGERGIQGNQGNDGPPGAVGQKGDKGDTGEQGPAGYNGLTPDCYFEESKCVGDKGSQGERGEKGDTASRPEFRCNPLTSQDEYKYPEDENWTSTGGKCEPVGEEI